MNVYSYSVLVLVLPKQVKSQAQVSVAETCFSCWCLLFVADLCHVLLLELTLPRRLRKTVTATKRSLQRALLDAAREGSAAAPEECKHHYINALSRGLCWMRRTR